MSHYRELTSAMMKTFPNIAVEHIKIDSHTMFTEDLFENILGPTIMCRRIVFGFTQWLAGHPHGRPTLFPEYHNMTIVLMDLLKSKENTLKELGAEVYIRSVHYVSLYKWLGDCPPKDWRSPPVIDGYNAILKYLCKERGISFIDTTFLIGPVWDWTFDWYHFDGYKAEQEIVYILSVMLSQLFKNKN